MSLTLFKEYFESKSVLVTGAGKGIGRGVAIRLHSYGAKVTALSRTESNLANLRDDCPGISTICVDLEDWDSTRKALTKVGPFHYLVNNAAILIPDSFMDIKPQDFEKMMNINVRGSINVGQIVAKGMIDAGIKGSILNMSSDASTSAFSACANYCLTKASMDMLTKLMAVELGPKQIRVNAVNPAGIWTDMLQEFYQGLADKEGITVDQFRKNLDAQVPLGSYEMELDEIVNAILFMLSPASPLIHGERLFIDGGLRIA